MNLIEQDTQSSTTEYHRPRKYKPIPHLSEKDIQRFWAKVDKSGGPDACWPWMAGLMTGGYGSFYAQGTFNLKASRVAFFLATGIDPAETDILHSCDNRRCVNNAHLRTGTNADNRADCVKRGRHNSLTGEEWHKRHADEKRFGEHNPNSKVTDEQVIQMRDAYARGDITLEALGKRYGLTKSGAHGIIRSKGWRHL